MKIKVLSVVVASGSLIALIASPFADARPRSHLHHRNDRLPRIARISEASSGSSLVEEGGDLCGKISRLLRQVQFSNDRSPDPNNVLAHAVAGIPFEEGPCSMHSPANTTTAVYEGPTTKPAATATLKDREVERKPPHLPYVHHPQHQQAPNTVMRVVTATVLTSTTTSE